MPGKPISKSKQKGLAALAKKKPELAKKFGYNPKRMVAKKGGKAKKKSKFPDHSGDGKITKKDILMAKGVIPKKKNKKKVI